MNVFLVVVSLAVGVLAEDGDIHIEFGDYHEDVGIPMANEIRLTESRGGTRIIGGTASNPGDYPYFGGLLVELTNGRESVCGSSLLTNTKVVTAAHCWRTSRFQGRRVTVVLGSVRLYSGGTRITTEQVEVHGSWNPATNQNDIAMITIEPVEFSDLINSIAIATGSDTYAGETATVVGFGKTGSNNPITRDQVLRNVTMPVITNEECQKTYGRYVTEKNVCTSTVNRSRGTCQGDSGGPLSVGSGESRLLIGIVSFGGRFCDRDQRKALSRVTAFASWINERI